MRKYDIYSSSPANIELGHEEAIRMNELYDSERIPKPKAKPDYEAILPEYMKDEDNDYLDEVLRYFIESMTYESLHTEEFVEKLNGIMKSYYQMKNL